MFKYFKPEEILGLDLHLVKKLDCARELAGIPFIISSGVRSQEHNTEVEGVENSAHIAGLAVDLKCDSSINRKKILEALLNIGFSRIGIAKDHIHVDIDDDKPQEVLFLEF